MQSLVFLGAGKPLGCLIAFDFLVQKTIFTRESACRMIITNLSLLPVTFKKKKKTAVKKMPRVSKMRLGEIIGTVSLAPRF